MKECMVCGLMIEAHEAHVPILAWVDPPGRGIPTPHVEDSSSVPLQRIEIGIVHLSCLSTRAVEEIEDDGVGPSL